MAVAMLAVAAFARADAVLEFRLEEARTIYPCYRTWEFEVEEPGAKALGKRDALPRFYAIPGLCGRDGILPPRSG